VSSPLIEVHELTWAYREDGLVLDRISFELGEGEIVGVIGPNGCGKTTLLHLLAGLLRPGVDGRQEGSFVYRHAGRKAPIGFVFQDYRESLFPWRNVYGNVRAGRELLCAATGRAWAQSDEDIVHRRISELGLEDVQNKQPFEISGGQAQLTCVARTLALNASLLILDEPTSSLHYNVRNMILDALLAERSESMRSILFSSHSLEEASLLGDRVVVLTPLPATVCATEQSDLNYGRRTCDLGSPAHLVLYKKLLALTTTGKDLPDNF